MRLLAPIARPEEVEMLVESGADELYCGVLPREWVESYGPGASLNRREGRSGNLETLAQLRVLTDFAHRLGAEVQLALNAQTYTEAQVPFVKRMAATAVDEIGIDALILADLGMMVTLMEWRPDLRIHVSSLAATHNRHALLFFRDLGATRVILPRQVRIAEAVSMAAAVPAMEIEVFVLNDGCIYEEGHCSTVHEIGPICLTDWRYQLLSLTARPESPRDQAALETHLRDYREWVDRHVGLARWTPSGVPGGPCGLCAIPELDRGGIHAVKVVGREATAYKKLRSVQQVRHLLDRVASGLSAEECRTVARALRSTPELCESGYGCYYPEVARDPEPPRGGNLFTGERPGM